MRSAESIIREVDARLDLPLRRRVALLRELRTDFEDLVATLVAEGCTEEAARSRALALLVPAASELDALVALHQPAYMRLAGRVPSRRARRIELAGIGAMAFLAGFLPLLTVTRIAGLPGWAGVALGGVAAMVVAHLAWQTFRLLVRQDVDAAYLARAGIVQGGLIGVTFAVGGLATALEAYVAAGSLATAVDVAALATSVAACAETAALTLSIGMLGLFGAAALFQAFLSMRSAEEELDRLLVDPSHHTGDPS